MNSEQTTVPTPTPTRKAARITVETQARIGAKMPVAQSTVLNVSTGGALIFTDVKQEEGSKITIELGPPIFPVSRLVRGRIKHIDEAPDELIASLHARGKIAKKKKGFLLGIEFSDVEKDDRVTLDRFVRNRAREERARRIAGHASDPHMRTALDRAMQVEKTGIPAWAYMLGLLMGSYELISGILNGASDLDVALHVGGALATFWFVGRIAASVWSRLEAWHRVDNLIIATSDGTEETIDEALADADSALDLPGDIDNDNDEGGRSPPEQKTAVYPEPAAA